MNFCLLHLPLSLDCEPYQPRGLAEHLEFGVQPNPLLLIGCLVVGFAVSLWFPFNYPFVVATESFSIMRLIFPFY